MTDLQEQLKSALSHAYDIQRELPGGGMSRVFVAIERALGRQVVIKVLPPELAAGVNTERFRREIQLSAQLNHPHIVPVLAAGEIGEMLYYTMPYIEGESLNNTVQKNGPLAPKEVLRILHDVVDAIAYAHSRGVIHRDIKPANILSLGNHALVTDFGVAKAISASLPSTGMTSGGFAIGTPAYMAPEQLAADPHADHRIDIYAVGLLAYELLTGTSPFTSTSPQATMAAQLTRVPAPLHKVRPDVPAVLSDLIQRCLEKLPENRPSTAQELLRELDETSTPQGNLTSRRPTLRAAFADPARHARYLAAMVALTVLMGGTVFAATTYLIDRATDLNAETRNAAGTAINDSAVGSLDSKAVHGLVAPVTTAQPAASPAVTEQDLAAFADSIRKQLTAEFQRDTAALSDSIRASIERDVIARIRAATSRGGDARQFAGSRGGNTPRSPEELRRLPFPGEKRVLVTDFNVRIGRPDSGLGARLGTELRAALRRTGEGYVAINGRDARQAAGSDDARVMIDYVHAGALLTGYVFPRGSDSVVVRMVMIEPARGTSPRPLGSYVVPIANADTAIVSFMPSAVEVLRRVTWPAGREGGRGRRGGAAAPGSRNAPPSSQATGPAGTPGTAPPTVPPPRDSGGPNHRME